MAVKSNVKKQSEMMYELKRRIENRKSLLDSIDKRKLDIYFDKKEEALYVSTPVSDFKSESPKYVYENNTPFLELRKEAVLTGKRLSLKENETVLLREEEGLLKEDKKISLLEAGTDILGKTDEEIMQM